MGSKIFRGGRSPSGVVANVLDRNTGMSSNSSHIITFTFGLIPNWCGSKNKSLY